MVGYGGAGHIQHGGDVHHTLLTVAQQPENADAAGGAQLPEDVRQTGKGIGLVQQLPDDFCVAGLLAVVVGQGHGIHSVTSFFARKEAVFARPEGSGTKPLTIGIGSIILRS